MNTTFILLSYETITGIISKILTRIKIYDNKTFLLVQKCCCPVTEDGLGWHNCDISYITCHMLSRTLFIPLLYCKCLPGKSA